MGSILQSADEMFPEEPFFEPPYEENPPFSELEMEQMEEDVAAQVGGGNGSVPLELRVKQYIIAIRQEARKDLWNLPPNRETVIKQIIVIGDRIINKKARKHVLSAILGVPVNTTNDVSEYVQRAIIDITEKEQHAGAILRQIEAHTIESFVRTPWDAYPDWNSPVYGSAVSNLPASDQEGGSGSARSADHEGTRNEVEDSRRDILPL